MRTGLSRIELATVLGIIALLFALLVPPVRKAGDQARKTQSKNRLKQLGLALHSYHDTSGRLPIGADVEANGTPKHSLYTRCLPFAESSPLYSWFSFDESWDHPVNEVMGSRHFPALLIPGAEPTQINGLALTHFAVNGNLMYRNGSVSFDQIKNTSGTWMAGEVSGDFAP